MMNTVGAGYSEYFSQNARVAQEGVIKGDRLMNKRMKSAVLGLGLALGLAGATAPLEAAQAAPAGQLIFGVDSAADQPVLDQVQYFWGGRNYCWYFGGWHGPGWYWCGYAWRRGFGWGGPDGWRGWHGGAGWRGRGPGGPGWHGGHPGGGHFGGHPGDGHGGGHPGGGHEGGDHHP